MRLYTRLLPLATACALFTACTPAGNAPSNTANTNAAAPAPAQALTVAERPQKIKDMMAQRGEQDSASPTIKIVEPREGATVAGPTVNVRLDLSGDLKGYHPMKDPATGMGNHIHVILDNQPYEAYYDIGQPFELRNVTAGKHTLRVFPSRPWHESYKNDGAFQMATFTVSAGGDASKPTTTNSGQVMAQNQNGNAAPQREGKDMAASQAGAVDPAKPLLTYSRPKGEYKGDDTAAIMIDFWLANAKLQGDGGEYRVRYSVDGAGEQFIDKWQPIWLSGWVAGKHKVKLELVDKSGAVVDNGGYNATEREITVTK
jgi:hypothetical protein